jgi:opacity protein-like surface antigen
MKRRLMTLLLACSISQAVNAAVVYLRDGSQVRGTIVSATAGEIEVYTQSGTQSISTDRISRIDYADEAPAVVPPPPSPESVPPPPQAQRWNLREPVFEDTRNSLTLGLGLAAPLSHIDFSGAGGGKGDNGGTGAAFGLQYLYNTSSRWALGMNVEFLDRSSANSQGLVPNADTAVFGDTFLLQALARYSFIDHGPVRPFLLAGAGANRTSETIDAAPVPGFSWSDTNTDETRRLLDQDKWGFASTARIGLDFHGAAPTFFTLEMGWTGIFNGNYTATPAGQDIGLTTVSGRLDLFTLTGRFGWRF